ncbi:MAG TPA: dephospho-CoA kinase [Alphaproteobacteria bacterium]|jgi:dephospho-CoA kinase|nr:dephospho-CoA kinase [Alphaproteobacteria bacterium]
MVRRALTRRLRPERPYILGLTGSIGMGKTTAAKALKRLHVPVFSSDTAVHRLLAPGGHGVDPVGDAFPAACADGGISRPKLASLVFGNPQALARLESILHPLVRAETERFLAAARRARRPVVVLDIPLLYEIGAEDRVHEVIVVTAPESLQRARVLARGGQTPERLKAILDRQIPDRVKRARADFIVPTGLSKRDSLRRLARIAILARQRRKA